MQSSNHRIKNSSLYQTTRGENNETELSAEAIEQRAQYTQHNRARPTDFMGGSSISFRDKPPAPIKIETGTSFHDNPFLKGRKMKSTTPAIKESK